MNAGGHGTAAEFVRRPSALRRPAAARRSAGKHAAILEAAAELAAAEGYAATTVEGIAARAGVGKQTIYRWWPSKAALFIEVYAWLVPPEALEADRGDAAADLRALLEALFTRYRETPAGAILAGLIAEAQSDRAALDALQRGLVPARRALLAAPLERGVARGDLPEGFDAALAGDALTALVWHALLTDPARLTDAFARRAVACVLGTRRAGDAG